MPANKLHPAPVSYTVWSGGRTHQGSAQDILKAIQEDATEDSSIKSMSLDEYAHALIEDAAFFVPKDALKFLNAQDYASEYDQALDYLGAMPSSGVRILSKV
jgi:hypothetical protein